MWLLAAAPDLHIPYRYLAAWDTTYGWSAWSDSGRFFIPPCSAGRLYFLLPYFDLQQRPISPGDNFTYRFSLRDEYGFFWYHSHFRAYYNDAIRGPLFIRPSASRPRPFKELASNSEEYVNLLQAETNAQSVLLNDWTHELSDTIFARYLETGAFPGCVDSILANGLGRVECLPEYLLRTGPALDVESLPSVASSMAMSSRMEAMDPATHTQMSGNMMLSDTTMSTTMEQGAPSGTSAPMHPTASSGSDLEMTRSQNMAGMPSTPSLGPRGCTRPMMFRPGFNASSLPPERCANTTSPRLTILANQTQGWLGLNLVNSGAVSALRVSLDAHSMFVYAADGLYVEVQEVKVSDSCSWFGSNDLTVTGFGNSYRTEVFSNDSTRPDCWRLLS